MLPDAEPKLWRLLCGEFRRLLKDGENTLLCRIALDRWLGLSSLPPPSNSISKSPSVSDASAAGPGVDGAAASATLYIKLIRQFI